MGCSSCYTTDTYVNQKNFPKDRENDIQLKIKDNKSINNYENFNNIEAFINKEKDPLEDYDYFDIKFTICNYIFIVPEKYIEAFSSFYSNILKDTFIIFAKDSQQAAELLNDYEKEEEEGNRQNWIFICPCIELENNIKTFQKKTNIYFFFGYCPIDEHDHDVLIFYRFPKYYDIVFSYSEFIKKLFELIIIINYKKKFKYELDNNNLDVYQLENAPNFFIELNNDESKDQSIYDKIGKYYNYKIKGNKYIFGIIKYMTLLNKFVEEKKFIQLFLFIGELKDMIIILNDTIEDALFCALFLYRLLQLNLYFFNYPYFYGALTDEEMNEIYSDFSPDITKDELYAKISSKFNEINFIVINLSYKIDDGISILNEKDDLQSFHMLLIEINFCIENYFKDYDPLEINKFYQIKNYNRDISFCLGRFVYNIFYYYCKNILCKAEILNPYMAIEKRLSHYGCYSLFSKYDKDIKNEEESKIFNKAIKYNDTVVIGDKNFHNIMIKMKLPCKNIYFLEEKEISNFFRNTKKLNNKYKISRYIFVLDGKRGIEFLETVKYISNTFGIKILTIIYIQDKNAKIDKKILQVPILPIVLVYSEKDILNYYTDINDRLREMKLYSNDYIQYYDNYYEFDYKFPKIEETKIKGEDDNGWDMKKDIQINLFNKIKVNSILNCINPGRFIRDMYKVYKENNCLDLFLNYYGNYFGADSLVEQQTSLLVGAKMFIYAYTLEEPNRKSLYSIMNNDLRSGNAERICRYLPIIKIIRDMIRVNYLKSYNGDVYRATYFKDELIAKIKPGEKMYNASLWSSTKNLTVAKTFLTKEKNILLHVKVKKGNNIDIDLEKLSQYPNEEEILFLPYCYFEIKSFKKVKEKKHEY